VKRLERAVALRWAIVSSALAAVAITVFLSVQMALGADPALGPKVASQKSGQTAPAPAPAAPTTAAVPPTTVVPTNVVPASPTVVTPVPAAPAPAPVQTTTS